MLVQANDLTGRKVIDLPQDLGQACAVSLLGVNGSFCFTEFPCLRVAKPVANGFCDFWSWCQATPVIGGAYDVEVGTVLCE